VSPPVDLPLVAVRAPGVALQWYEGVAVVAELASLAAAAQRAAPGLEDVWLTDEGRVMVAPAPPAPPAPPAETVQGLGALLAALLEGRAAPAELRTAAGEAAAGAPDLASLEAFARALSFFERPERRAILALLAQRTREVLAQAEAHEALEQLMERARHQQDARVEQKQPPPPRQPLAARRRRLGAVAVVAAIVVTAAWLVLQVQREGGASEAGALVSRAQAQLTGLAQAGLKSLTPVRQATPPAQAEPAPAATQPARAARRAAGIARAAVSGAPADPTTDAVTPSGSSGNEVQPRWHVEELEGVPIDYLENDAEASPGAVPVYAAGDPDVRPPALLRQQLPSGPPPGLDLGDVGVLELVVNTRGEVESARLVTTGRFQERMIVAAAKTWKFSPAVKDGQPVKYRTRVRVTL
jgi:hypothetical protein